MGRLGLSSRVDLPANAVFAADGAGGEVSLTVGEDRILGRLAGGAIDDLTPAQIRTLLGVTTGSGGAPNTWYASDYAGVDPSGTTDSLAGLNLWWADVQDYDIAVLPPGRYRLSGTLNLTGKSATIIMDGATLIGTTTAGLLQIAGTVEATQAVASLTERKTTAGEYGAGGANMWVTDFTISAGAPAWRKGDMVWVTADDLVPPASATVRSGQPMVVLEVSGTRATCMGILRDSFTTNVRMARYAVNANGEHHRVSLRGATLTWTDAILDGGTATNYALRVKALIEPVVEHVTVLGANGQAIEVKNATYAALIDECRVRRADDETGTAFGYGVNDSGVGTRVRGLIANRVRHAFSTGASTGISANAADLLTYGRADGFEVTGCLVEGSSDNALDGHGDGARGWFHNNRIRNCRGGIYLRGVQYVINGLWVEGGCNAGVVQVDTASSSADSWGSIIRGVVVDDVAEPDNGIIHVRSTSGFESRPTWVDDIWLRSTDDGLAPSGPMIKADNATVEVGRVMASMTGITWTATANGGVIRTIDWWEPPTTSTTVRNSCDGADGATVVNSNSGTGGDAFSNTVTASSGAGARTFAAAASMVSGQTGIRCTGGAGDTGTVGWVIASKSVRITGRIRFSANPTVDSSRFLEIRTASAVACAVGRTTAGLPGIKGSGASATLSNAGATAVPLNTWLEFEVTAVGDTNNADGVLEVTIWRFPTRRVPLYQVQVTNLAMGLNGADITQLKFGKPHSVPAEGNIDLRDLSCTYDVAITAA